MPMNSMNTISLTQCLKQSFSTSGLPVILWPVTDFHLLVMKKMKKMKKNGIKHTFTAAYHASSNRTTKRSGKTFKNDMKQIKGNNAYI